MTNAQLRRLVAAISVLVYACFVASAVFFPLPGPYTTPPSQGLQLVPFQWVDDVCRELRYTGFSLTDVFTAPAFEGTALNVLLFVPLGIFARMLFKRGFVGTMLIGFACSLFIETTQLTANWGTARFQYRIFDVDDLINNTVGATLGWIAAALFLALVGATRRADTPSYPDRFNHTDRFNYPNRFSRPAGFSHPDRLSYTAASAAKARPVHQGAPAEPPYARPPVAWLAGPPRQPSQRRP
ncbi:VanZ family protein [Amycolatopsis taiwanensis]|uniref:VanZ family protein n=1 Tax=Amycolatopsis taiwanensis TaxID=342230 RepID=UPI0004ADC9B5|nr:VanZ family protein [Amycolatopsis taiwanensis]